MKDITTNIIVLSGLSILTLGAIIYSVNQNINSKSQLRKNYNKYLLEQYSSDIHPFLNKGYYIHFTNNPNIIDINPKRSISTSGGPLGFYCYEFTNTVLKTIHFANDRKYIILVKPINQSSIIDVDKYSKNDLKKDINKLQSLIDPFLIDKAISKLDKYLSDGKLPRVYSKPIGNLYYILSKVDNKLIDPEYPISYSDNSIYDYRLISKLFLELGYTGLTDHYGLIWNSEPEQTVFFTMNNLEIKNIFINNLI